jgi:hypothetical protein
MADRLREISFWLSSENGNPENDDKIDLSLRERDNIKTK